MAVKGDDRVIDVMADITEGEEDVALVYDGSTLLGIFTESDYINVSSSSRSSSSSSAIGMTISKVDRA